MIRPLVTLVVAALATMAVAEDRPLMVVSAHPLATEAGFQVLEAGGSAADAAIVVQLVLGLVEPHGSGLGGGGFALYWDETAGRLTSYDGRETAPLAAGPDYWLDAAGRPLDFATAAGSSRAVGVPGLPRLLQVLHESHGRVEWDSLFAPAIALAEGGFPVSADLALALRQREGEGDDPAFRAYFLHPDGSPRQEGEILTNPAHAQTLRLVADGGADAFYQGPPGQAIRAVTALTSEDFRSYEVIERPPLCLALPPHEICGMGPPSAGGLVVAQILGLLARLDDPDDPAAQAHLFIEAARLAQADRDLHIADPAFHPPPAGLLAPAYLDARAALILPDRRMAEARAGDPSGTHAPDPGRPREGTSHFVITDRYGDMISMTTTIERNLGARIMVGGFLLNNELTDFSFRPEIQGLPVANRVEGGKRPRSSMAPTVVFRDGRPVLLIGSPGGSAIPSYVAASLTRILNGTPPQEVVAAPHVIASGDLVLLEPAAASLTDGLLARGHDIRFDILQSGLHALLITPAGLLSGVDPRRSGTASPSPGQAPLR